METRPVCLLIMDGYAIAESGNGNAISLANSENIERYMKEYPSTLLGASGLDVGLPDGQMGNSEVGHLNMGAGRIVYQELTRITKSIKDGDFFDNVELNFAMDKAIENGKKLHLYGLLSDGGVHSHNTHLYALLELAKKKGVKEVYVHCFLDGRDVPPTSGADFIKDLQTQLDKIGVGKIATVGGRYYVMDRDNRWERVEKAYDAFTLGNGERAENAYDYVKESYDKNVTDEFVIPCNIYENGKPIGLIEEGDSIIFFNFRPDRAREITRAMSESEFVGFERKTGFLNPTYVCFTQYDATFTNVRIAFKPQVLNNTLGEYLSKQGFTQLRIAETEKYAHVTFFFNGGVEKANENEDRELIASPKVATYDLQPEMSANEVTEKVLEKLDSNKYDVVILNYANCDMVGHTAVNDAVIKAVETVDECVGKIHEAVKAKGGVMLITADHGNADCIIDEDGKPMTAHTTSPVPLIVTSNDVELVEKTGKLGDLAPTMLYLLNLEIPSEMEGKVLVKNK